MEELEYNDEEAVKFIHSSLSDETKKKINSGDIEYILDSVFNFYDENGYLDEDNEEVVDIDEEEIFNYIMSQIIKEKQTEKFTEEIVTEILDGEYAYCESLGIFDVGEE